MNRETIARVMGLYLSGKIDKCNVPIEISEVANTIKPDGLEEMWQFVLDESDKLCDKFNKQ